MKCRILLNLEISLTETLIKKTIGLLTNRFSRVGSFLARLISVFGRLWAINKETSDPKLSTKIVEGGTGTDLPTDPPPEGMSGMIVEGGTGTDLPTDPPG